MTENRTQKPRPFRRGWVLLAAGTVAAAVGGTAVLATASAGRPPSALAATTRALAKTSAESYSFTLVSTMRFRGRYLHSDVVSGEFDPRHGLGLELVTTRVASHSVSARIRFIGKFVYTWLGPGSGFRFGSTGDSWDKAPIPKARADDLPPGDLDGFLTDQPVSLVRFAEVLRSAQTVRDEGPAAGPGWAGIKYAFTTRLSGGRASIAGTVYVDRQGEVRRLVTVTTQGSTTRDRDLTFSDFNGPVSVTRPPVSQVKYTSVPYWGLYF